MTHRVFFVVLLCLSTFLVSTDCLEACSCFESDETARVVVGSTTSVDEDVPGNFLKAISDAEIVLQLRAEQERPIGGATLTIVLERNQ